MYERYPADIRAFLDKMGGLDNMPLGNFWHLGAKELWQMGYNKCSPG
jgi:hypothetical protein